MGKREQKKKLSKNSEESEKKSGNKNIDKDTRIVLDSNEFIFGITGEKDSCKLLLDKAGNLTILVPFMVVKEAVRNLENDYRMGSQFYQFVEQSENIAIVYEKPPEELVNKYAMYGLSEEDRIIGAFCEWVGARYLISENRHFLEEVEVVEFKIINAETAFRLIK